MVDFVVVKTFFFFSLQLLVGKYVENVKITKLSQPITTQHVRINPQYWERGLCTKLDLLGCNAGHSGNKNNAMFS